jgi:xanthine dehydrogenase YagT iron-sulfur-binding subunit
MEQINTRSEGASKSETTLRFGKGIEGEEAPRLLIAEQQRCIAKGTRMDGGKRDRSTETTGSACGAQEPVECRSGARCEWPFSRRDFVIGAGAAAVGATSPALWSSSALVTPAAGLQGANDLPLSLTVNGEEKHLNVDPRTSLLDLLRENLKLTGTKKGCDHGQCGACTVLVAGLRVNSCLTLAVSIDGEQITTIEGLAKGDELHPVQEAFLNHDGFQCGYCTPGQIISAVALISEVKSGAASAVTHDLRHAASIEVTDDEIRERMSGNICRCGAYPGIVAAVRQACGKSPANAAVTQNSSEDSIAAL